MMCKLFVRNFTFWVKSKIQYSHIQDFQSYFPYSRTWQFQIYIRLFGVSRKPYLTVFNDHPYLFTHILISSHHLCSTCHTFVQVFLKFFGDFQYTYVHIAFMDLHDLFSAFVDIFIFVSFIKYMYKCRTEFKYWTDQFLQNLM